MSLVGTVARQLVGQGPGMGVTAGGGGDGLEEVGSSGGSRWR